MPDINYHSESIGNIPQDSETFGNLPNDAEHFRSVPKPSERRENHTLTVREVARMFEAAGVARTERSIINWCQPGKFGAPRLHSYFDPNERKYYITPQSVGLAIKEEQAKAAKSHESTESIGDILKPSENSRDPSSETKEDVDGTDIKTLQREARDLKITNQAKDYYIERLETEREGFVEKLMISSHRVGELEARLLQLEAPKRDVELSSDGSTEVRE